MTTTAGVSLRNQDGVAQAPAYLMVCNLTPNNGLHITLCDDDGRTYVIELNNEDAQHVRKVLSNAK